jgi:hypothetical protein
MRYTTSCFPIYRTVGPVLLSQAHHGPGKQHAIRRGTTLTGMFVLAMSVVVIWACMIVQQVMYW